MHISAKRTHRLIKWLGLEETLEIQLVQATCHEQGHLPLCYDSETRLLRILFSLTLILPGMKHPQPAWATCSRVSPPTWPAAVPHYPRGSGPEHPTPVSFLRCEDMEGTEEFRYSCQSTKYERGKVCVLLFSWGFFEPTLWFFANWDLYQHYFSDIKIRMSPRLL